MSELDLRLLMSAFFGISVAIVLIVRGRFHPFIALLCGAFTVGFASGHSMVDTVAAVQKGAGDVLGGTGLVVALGLALGAMLQLSDGAGGLARALLSLATPRRAPWISLLLALVIGLPLFFETGVVLLLPVIGAIATRIVMQRRDETMRLRILLPAIAGLATLHALVPPHPGPLVAVGALHADLARTMVYGVIVGIPTAIIAGPLFASLIASRVTAGAPMINAPEPITTAPGVASTLIALLLPVALITAGEIPKLMPGMLGAAAGWLEIISNPVFALTLANLAAMPLLFRKRMFAPEVQSAIWLEAMKPAGTIILAIGAGGALKQVLVAVGLADLAGRLAAEGRLPPLLLAWLVAVMIRLATGSATVATITTAGIVPSAIAASGVSPEWAVLAIGAGSIFFSHVNDPGFWLVKSYLGTTTAGTFRTWSTLTTIVSVVALALIMIGSRFY